MVCLHFFIATSSVSVKQAVPGMAQSTLPLPWRWFMESELTACPWKINLCMFA